MWQVVRRKLARHGVNAERQRERLGHATLPRPDGRLIWLHAASVGESVSALTLVQALLDREPDLSALITSGTASSAQVLAGRMPARCLHQFAPLDQRRAMRRFLDHWHPEAAIFVESEIWPTMLVETRRRGLPLALINARMSRSSLQNWGRFRNTARFLLGQFDLIRTQDQATLEGLQTLGISPDRLALGPNLKALAPPLPADDAALAAMRAAMPGPVWLAASTHEGEEKKVIEAHLKARKSVPDLRLILVPRHPERAPEIARLITAKGLSHSRRSEGAAPRDAAEIDVYLADTLGEMGLRYRRAPIVFLGGSLVRAGGHNPLDPAQAGAAILHGPHVANFADVYAGFEAAGACARVTSPRELAKTLGDLLHAHDALTALRDAARTEAQRQAQSLDALIDEITVNMTDRPAGQTAG
jgi:3-deoxy-D-manno-octulosonic-acid transferase